MGRETNKRRRQRQAATAREKAAAARAEQRRAEQRRRAWSVITGLVVLAVVGALIAVIAINSGNSKQANDRVSIGARSPVFHDVTSVTPASLQTVGAGSAQLLAKPTSGDPPLTSNGKPELLYIGGEFCPFCAAERWSMVQALSRFGKLSNLSQIRSATNDGNYATFSFYKSSYTSKYLSFVPVENEDRNHKELEKLTSQQAALFGKYTTGFPFLDFGGKYVQLNDGYDPSLLAGKTWQQIATALKDPSSDLAKGILGEANNLTATICKMTNNQPSNVCLTPTITTLQSKLPSA